MRTQGNRWSVAAFVMLTLAVLANPAWAQRAPARQNQTARQQLASADIERLFDAYTVMQAQEALALDGELLARFLPKLKALQDTRRRLDAERQRMTNRLSRVLASVPPVGEAALRDELKSLDDFDGRAAAETRAASEALAQTLDLRRRAKFRVFEWQMERRKLELVLRARGASAGQVQ